MMWAPLVIALVVGFVVLWWPDDEAAGEFDRRLDQVRRARTARRIRRRRGDPGLRIIARLRSSDGPPAVTCLDADGWRRLRDGLARTHRRL